MGYTVHEHGMDLTTYYKNDTIQQTLDKECYTNVTYTGAHCA